VITPLKGAQVWHAFSRDLSFTCTPRVHPLTEWTILPLPSSRSWYSFTDPGGMEGWVGLGWLV